MIVNKNQSKCIKVFEVIGFDAIESELQQTEPTRCCSEITKCPNFGSHST